jgi:hypothetical protein
MSAQTRVSKLERAHRPAARVVADGPDWLTPEYLADVVDTLTAAGVDVSAAEPGLSPVSDGLRALAGQAATILAERHGAGAE